MASQMVAKTTLAIQLVGFTKCLNEVFLEKEKEKKNKEKKTGKRIDFFFLSFFLFFFPFFFDLKTPLDREMLPRQRFSEGGPVSNFSHQPTNKIGI